MTGSRARRDEVSLYTVQAYSVQCLQYLETTTQGTEYDNLYLIERLEKKEEYSLQLEVELV